MVALHEKLRVVFLACTVLFGVATASQAAGFPDRALTLVVPFSPGGGHDFTARLLASKLDSYLGQQVIVINKPGADGMIGAQYVARSKPDGYTLVMSSPAETVIAPFLYKNMSYDPGKDLSPVTLVGITPIALIANPSFPPNTVTELVAYVKAHPGTVNYGTPGVGSAQQLAVDWIDRSTGIKMLDVPYKGAGPATLDVLAGQVPLASVGMAPVMPHWKEGKLKVLAIMDNKRLKWLPDVPTASETAGAGAVDVVQWMGLFAPAGTPKAIIDKLNTAFAKVLHDPAVRKTMIGQGVDPVGNSVADFSKYLKQESRKYAALVKESGISAK
ncbi:tripartite tricarboxylate transporter substrate binding protein [Paralcaligenes sp. KSB-10]|uniref:Bug family tripartite tricarboxylate transporter substrate binding protein n=1 Tax=Paralcaligenes sp. KSB-10 TaxID=2901142 RepID=UPI001E4165EB|nr:tripartite tricarboxylate transporter substrate binding protein [Paralcaligenes sp. KSB-10]UHL62924.1 tripartite tricarboxylate transporter substrate binding protein [Paralcaligenes sp. KSB-10]